MDYDNYKTLRRGASDTEIEANAKVSGRENVMDFMILRELTLGNGTGSELADRTGILLLNVRPRLTALQHDGFIRDSGLRRKNERDNNERVVEITPFGLQILQRNLEEADV
jgi:DNA-binding MarR family transcriptional regulator